MWTVIYLLFQTIFRVRKFWYFWFLNSGFSVISKVRKFRNCNHYLTLQAEWQEGRLGRKNQVLVAVSLCLVRAPAYSGVP